MRKYIFKTIILNIVLAMLCFINTTEVKAADSCTCYYSWHISGASETANLSGYYYAKIKYTKNKASEAKYCMYEYTTSNDGNNDMSTTPTKLDKDCNGNIAIDDEFSADYQKIVDANCSKDACSSAKVYIKANPKVPSLPGSLTTKDPCSGFINGRECFLEGASQALTPENFQQGVDNNNNRTTQTDNYIDDIDPSTVVPSDPTIKKAEKGITTCDVIPTTILNFLKNLFFIIQVIGILLLATMTIIEFIKAITGSDEDTLRKAVQNTFKRIIITVILLILPVIVIWVLEMVNKNAYETDKNGKYVIGDQGQPLCKW